MFNTLVINPAYAGAENHLSIGLLHRTQWFGIGGRGTPQTQTVTVHSPLKNNRVGIGGSLVNDQIGATNTFTGNLAYSYRIPLKKWSLAIGMQGGAQYYNFDPSRLTLVDPTDYAFVPYSKIRPNFGGGLYLSKDKDTLPKQFRHYFFMTGAAIPINGNALIFKPSLMVRNTGLLSNLSKQNYYKGYLAPTSFDLDLSLLFYETLWLGASYRSALEQFSGKSSFSSVNAWGAYYLKNGMRIGLSYDYGLTKLQQAAQGSFEIFLGYDFDFKVRKVDSPRYF
jgi:hypothetical protein